MEIFKKDGTIALDIGSSSVKLARFVRREAGLFLSETRIVELSKTKDELSALKEILSGIGLKNSRCISLLNAAHAMVKRVVVPPMPAGELKQAIALEAKNYFPFSISDSMIDFEAVGEVLEKGVKKIALLLAVCPYAAIKGHLDMLKQAGVRPEKIVHPNMALSNVLRLGKIKDAQSIAALDIGKTFCELIILKGSTLSFSRKIPISGDDFTKALTATLFSEAGKLQLSYEDAERIKKEYGMPHESMDMPIENKITPIQILSLLRPLAEKLANEIARSFDFYREESQGSKVDRLILFGGGAQLRGLDTFLGEGLGIEAAAYKTLDGIALSEQFALQGREIGRVALCVGAGINKPAGINFMPLEIKQEMQRALQKATLKAAISACMTFLVLIFIGLRIHLAALDKKISAAQLELRAIRQQVGEVRDCSVLSDILGKHPYYEDVLRELSNVIPGGLYVKEMSMQKGRIGLKGVILPASGNSEETISLFARSLERGIFKNVKFVALQEISGLKEYELQMEVK